METATWKEKLTEILLPQKLERAHFIIRFLLLKAITMTSVFSIASYESKWVYFALSAGLYLYTIFYALAPRHRMTSLGNYYKLFAVIPIVMDLYAILLMLEPDKQKKREQHAVGNPFAAE